MEMKMPLMKSSSKKAYSHNVAAEVNAGKPQKQAVAIAYSEKAKHMADGGDTEPSDDDMILDQCARECMQAIENKDKEAFVESLHMLLADLMQKMSSDGQE
jgi:hypothetical protein